MNDSLLNSTLFKHRWPNFKLKKTKQKNTLSMAQVTDMSYKIQQQTKKYT